MGRFAFPRASVVTIPEVTHREDLVVGAGAVVIRDVPPGVTGVSVSARERPA
ncbi:MAG TPA: hypothetical protein VJL31_14300 [Gemmatimonadales bacterium]|nr:hypothetical protein [Gemmatimonadales bacterium]